jgi:hypothetical protein
MSSSALGEWDGRSAKPGSEKEGDAVELTSPSHHLNIFPNPINQRIKIRLPLVIQP